MTEKRHHPTIAETLAPIVKYGTEANVIDAFNRVWHVVTNHSGFILNGVNHEGHIPYWSSYFLSLPGVRLFVGDTHPEPRREPITISDVIEAHGAGFYVDSQGIEWLAKLCVHSEGYELEQCADNAWLPWSGCKVLSLPGFQFMHSEQQYKNRLTEWATA